MAQLCGAAGALREGMGWQLPPAMRAEYDRAVAAAREELGAQVFAAEWARGHALPLEEAIIVTLNNDE